MKTALLIFLVVVLGNVFVVKALKCYTCAGSETSDCYNGVLSSMVIRTCPPLPSSVYSHILGSFNASPFQEVCLRIVETNTAPKLYVRGCGVLPANVDPCDYLKQNLPVSSCKSCGSDLCGAVEEQPEFIDVNIL